MSDNNDHEATECKKLATVYHQNLDKVWNAYVAKHDKSSESYHKGLSKFLAYDLTPWFESQITAHKLSKEKAYNALIDSL